MAGSGAGTAWASRGVAASTAHTWLRLREPHTPPAIDSARRGLAPLPLHAPAFRMAEAASASVEAIMEANSAPCAQLKPRSAKPSTNRMTGRRAGGSVGGRRAAGGVSASACAGLLRTLGLAAEAGEARCGTHPPAAVQPPAVQLPAQQAALLTRREDDGAHDHHHKGHEHRVHPQLGVPGRGRGRGGAGRGGVERGERRAGGVAWGPAAARACRCTRCGGWRAGARCSSPSPQPLTPAPPWRT